MRVAAPEFSAGSLELTPVSAGAAALDDYDNDGLLDLVLTGDSAAGPISQIWRNQGGNDFSNINAGLPGLNASAVAWGDLDRDGLLDLAISGRLANNQRVTQVWRNQGDDTFANINAGLTGVDDGSLAWGDYNNDGRLDVVLVGSGNGGGRVTQVWRSNVLDGTNTPPTAPTNPQAGATGNRVELSWNAATDTQTPAEGLSYNLAIGASPGGGQILAPQSDLATGWRRLPALGRVQLGTRASLDLAPGIYFWAVQAVDGAWAGGPFADGGSFIVAASVEVSITAYERRGASQFWLRFTGEPAVTYRVEWSEDLAAWHDLGAATEATPGQFEYLDTGASVQRRFYRAATP